MIFSTTFVSGVACGAAVGAGAAHPATTGTNNATIASTSIALRIAVSPPDFEESMSCHDSAICQLAGLPCFEAATTPFSSYSCDAPTALLQIRQRQQVALPDGGSSLLDHRSGNRRAPAA